jgi:hypothetical protein
MFSFSKILDVATSKDFVARLHLLLSGTALARIRKVFPFDSIKRSPARIWQPRGGVGM